MRISDWSSDVCSSDLIASSVSLLSFVVYAFKLALRADVICSHWMVPCGLFGALIARVLGKPHVVIEHSGGLHLLRRVRAGRCLARFIVNGANRVDRKSVV